MLPGKKYTPEEALAILRKRKWLIVIPFVLGIAVAPPIARAIPNRYRSETVIMVVPQRVSDSLVRATANMRVEERLPAITDQIMSRSRLERIIAKLDLYPALRKSNAMEDVVQRMRADIAVELDGKSKESFRVSYVSTSPTVAQQVTESLASLYVEEDLRDRENLAKSTDLLLESQLQDAKQRLLDQEHRLQEYRQRFSGQLPDQLPGNLQSMQNAQVQLQNINESTNRARERRILLERQVADVRSTLPEPTPVASEANVTLTPAQQLEAAEARLAALKLRYKPDHPDVRILERVIRDLRAQIARDGQAAGNTPPKPVTVSSAEAARQRRERDLQSEIEVIDHQIAANEAEAERLKKTIASYQADIDALPKRESELVELTRDYGTLQTTYASLLAKREDSKLAANLERRQIGEQWKILDPASLPQKPYNQMQRLAFMFGGVGAGLVLGICLVAFLELKDSSFKREEDVVQVLSLPVLALIPVMPSADDDGSRRKRRIAAGLGVLLVFVVSAAALFMLRGRL